MNDCITLFRSLCNVLVFFEADGFLSIAMVLLVTVGRTIDDSFKVIFTPIFVINCFPFYTE